MTSRRTTAAAALSGLLVLAACTTPGQVGGGLSRAEQGTLIGVGAGAVAGQILGRDSEATAVGAVLGGALGAAIGYNLDQQEAELRRDLDNDVGIVNTGDRLIVRLPQDLLFATDSFAVRPDLRADLFTVAGSLQRYPQSTVQIVGHTDSDGDADYNQRLSERRANAVSAVLGEAGVAPSRLQAIGRGESQPVASNLSEEGKALNRRVEIVILPRV